MDMSSSRRIAVLDAPSNLGLRPPAEGSVPGVYKLPWALRDSGLVKALGALDAGSVIPPRYVASWQAGSGTRNAAAIACYSRKLAARIADLMRSGHFPLVLGGDCSILIAAALALREEGPFGLAFLDAHSDFRHPGNADAIQAAAGEDLAICTGRGDPLLTALGAGSRLLLERDAVLVGTREEDEYLGEVRTLGMQVVTAEDLKRLGAGEAATRIASLLARGAGAERFWIHCDLDVVDREEMWAVDSPEPEGPGLDLIVDLVGILAADRRCRGMHIAVYDPDLDPELRIARRLVEALVAALAGSFAAAR